jgi:hypothetical protein
MMEAGLSPFIQPRFSSSRQPDESYRRKKNLRLSMTAVDAFDLRLPQCATGNSFYLPVKHPAATNFKMILIG